MNTSNSESDPVNMKDFVSSGNIRLDAQLKFTAEIDKMTSVMRRTMLLDKSRRENDAEHSWHIAVMALLFEEYALEKPDLGHAISMLVVHDLIEVYAGDTFAYDVEANKDKATREEAAADKLFSILPEDQGRTIRQLWEEFDACTTVDAKYANCLDRIQPFYHNVLTQGYTWHSYGIQTNREQVEKRMNIVREFMPDVYTWAMKCMDYSIEQNWLLP